jgi:outer membrane immunogenic protein
MGHVVGAHPMKIRARLIAGAVAAGFVWSPAPTAFAADFPHAEPLVRAPVPVAAPYSWYGFYIGIQGGYGFGGNGVSYTPNASYAPLFAPGPGTVADDPRGFLGGITYGTNFQFGRFVVGTESDWSFTNIKRSETFGPSAGFAASVTADQQLQWFATTRARGGILVTENWLVYGTGGLASATAESSTSFNLVAPAACAGAGNCPSGSRSKRLWGWTAGGGLEFAEGPWSLKAEYLYYDLGKLNYSVTDPSLPAGVITASSKVSGHVVRAGLNYRFNWTLLDLVLGR